MSDQLDPMPKSREEVDRTAWALIDALPQSPVSEAGLARSGRPKSFSELELLLSRGIDMECALNMFLDEFYQHRDPSFFAEPPSPQLVDINRAALAGIAEHLSHRFGYEVPAWTEEPAYFLAQERDWFEGTFDQEFLAQVNIRDAHLKGSTQEFLVRNLLFPVRGFIRV